MSSVWDFLKGKKTYIVAAVSIASAGIALWNGSMTAQECLAAVLAAITAATVRNGVATEIKKLK